MGYLVTCPLSKYINWSFPLALCGHNLLFQVYNAEKAGCVGMIIFSDPYDYECLYIPADNFSVMGFSVRVADARFTEWRNWTAQRVGDWSDKGACPQAAESHTAIAAHLRPSPPCVPSRPQIQRSDTTNAVYLLSCNAALYS